MKEREETEFAIMMAPVNGSGTWGALKELRAGLRELRQEGTAKILFVDALDKDGRAVPPHDPKAVALVVGYSVTPS